jgi:thiosulfate/3-mercaptopyruvate sulfurtransferase
MISCRCFQFIFTLALSLAVLSCAEKPTQIYTSEDVDVLFLEKNLVRPIEITNSTVIIDARSPFDFAMVHHPNAINLQWTDFSDTTEGASPGLLKKDLALDAQRLAFAGVDLNSQVVVVGKAFDGLGAEGRIAWVLLYMGVRDVQTADVDSLGLRYSNLSPPPRENKPIWKPAPHESIIVSKDEFLETRHDPSIVKVIDVRTPLEFSNKKMSLAAKYPEMHAINISWTQFFTIKGRPNAAVRKTLADAHIGLHDRILLISNQGVRSGAVTYALLALGFKNAANYTGGYVDLLDLKK